MRVVQALHSDASATLPTAVGEVMMPCTSCGVQVSEGEALGDADTEWLCEGCFPKSVLHENGFFQPPEVEPK